MYTQSLTRAVAATFVALLMVGSYVGAQGDGPQLKITRPQSSAKQGITNPPDTRLGRDAAFARLAAEGALTTNKRNLDRIRAQGDQLMALRQNKPASALTAQGFGTGGGDVFELEPNDRVAQGVSLPVNIIGEISVDGDTDYFAFQALAGQRVTVEAFAARLSGSRLVADIALFDGSGNLLDDDTGGENNDPVIRYLPPRDEVLIVGIADADDFGGRAYDYLLNITRGVDIEEVEPNNRQAQNLTDLPATMFGDIDGSGDVDFYSFVASAGQTLIVDVDAEVLGSRLDPEINLLDPTTGVEFFYNDQYDGDDARYNIVLPYTGRYVIGIGSFDSNSTGFYRLNASLVSGVGAPVITAVTRLAKKSLEATGATFTADSVVEVNSVARKTTFINSGTLRAKVKAKVGDVVTVRNPPDDRRSNPLVVQ